MKERPIYDPYVAVFLTVYEIAFLFYISWIAK